MQAYFTGENAETVAGEFGKSPLYKMLGYFSLIALLRVHSMLGDYHLAVKVLENIDLHKNVRKCIITHLIFLEPNTEPIVPFTLIYIFMFLNSY
jgi:hypothetical protein